MTKRATLASTLRDERGSVIVLVAACLLVFLIGAAFVVDIGNARQVARNYQNAADGAALAGAQGLPDSALLTPTPVDYAADYAFQTLLGVSRPAPSDCGDTQLFPAGEPPIPAAGAGTPQCYTLAGLRVYVTTPWTDTPADTTPLPGGWAVRQINVKVCGKVVAGFARVVGVDFVRPCRRATAMSALGTGPCALCVLDRQPTTAFQMSGNSSALITGASAWINATSSSAAVNSGTGTLTANDGFYVGGSSTGFTPPAIGDAPEIVDPLAWLPDPRSLQAPWQDWTTLPLHNDLTLECANPGDTVTIPYGIYPSIKVIPRGPRTCDGTNTIRLSGFYAIRHSFEIKTDANIVSDTAPGVTIYFACDSFPENPCDPGDHAYFEHIGAGTIDLHASTLPSGHPYTHLLFFFDRNNQSLRTHFAGAGATYLTGTMYGRTAEPELSGSGTYNSLFVVDKMKFSGSGLLNITYDPSEQVPTFLPALIS
jgi:hypothetical protein